MSIARVLIADDEEQYRQVLQRSLERAGYAVTAADNGRTALVAAMQSDHDIAVLDLLMPEMEGLETIRELKSRRPAMPLIAMTGGGVGNPVDYLRAARLLGAAATLEKPFTIQDLLRTISAALATAAAGRGL